MIEWMYEPKYKEGIKEANNNQIIPKTINVIAGNLYLLWGCVRQTRTLHDEEQGILIYILAFIRLWLVLTILIFLLL